MANLKAAIAGIGESRVGRVPDRSALQLQTDAAQAALADAGLKMSDIDGLLTTPCASNTGTCRAASSRITSACTRNTYRPSISRARQAAA